MARRKKSSVVKAFACRRCGLLSESTDFDMSDRPGRWLGGLCPGCRDQKRRERHSETGQRLLDRAKTGTVVRDGKEYVVKVLPPKRRGGHR